ncbi:FxsA family protein [Peribacillus phoenicis]|uniref:FxsA family protein n=1 Tax=unclassified Peribacillus TaxID=2675266 RepID=UPI0039A3BF3E
MQSHCQLPGDALLDGICILGGVLLLTQGFTNITGFLKLFQPTRRVFKFLMINAIQRKLGNIKIIK